METVAPMGLDAAEQHVVKVVRPFVAEMSVWLLRMFAVQWLDLVCILVADRVKMIIFVQTMITV